MPLLDENTRYHVFCNTSVALAFFSYISSSLRIPNAAVTISLSHNMFREKESGTKLDGILAQVVSNLDNGSFNFAGESGLPSHPELTPEQERRLWRKIDLRLLPMLGLMYLMPYLDRGA